jgi:hypothetical protein
MVKRSLKQNGGVADVPPLVRCQIGFVYRCSDRDQAFQADGIERTISISPVRKNSWEYEKHRAASFPGRISTYKRFGQIDGQFSTHFWAKYFNDFVVAEEPRQVLRLARIAGSKGVTSGRWAIRRNW